MEQIADEVHKPIKKQKEFRKVIVYYPNDIWSADIVEMGSEGMKEQNEGYKYILVCIDIWSRYAWTRKMKTKTGKETAENFKSIIAEAGHKPNALWVDEGLEFYNSDVKKVFKNVKIYSTYGEGKASYVERLNRTLKGLMYKQFTVKQNRKWINILSTITQNYNDTVHSRTGFTPKDMYKNKPNIPTEIPPLPDKIPKYKVGDRVRISYKRRPTFDKAYLPNWTWEIFTVSKVLSSNPWTYKLKDYQDDEIKGSFYDSELQRTKQKKDTFLVEKILSTKREKGKLYALVKWLGYENPTWEKQENVKDFSILK